MNLKAGVYHEADGAFGRPTAHRTIASRGSRICMEIGRVSLPFPYERIQYTTVSSVSLLNGKLVVDATDEELEIDSNSDILGDVPVKEVFHVTAKGEGSPSVAWKYVADASDPDDLPERYVGLKELREIKGIVEECLSSTGKYEKTVEQFFPGKFLEKRKGKLIAKDLAAQINVRTGSGTSHEIAHYGIVGDKVILSESTWDDTRAIWYQVKFEGSGAEGWIRSDFVQQE